MDADELDPRPAPASPPNLEAMSIEALAEYIASLESEIRRAREVIAAKQDARSSADAVFRRE
ncbi:MAG: DUF1192 domain-containing protein [Rhodospirillaceae bacterium]|nr:DUF1192 domain-containing protein [Rhodospirillaceae bacterium]